MKFRLKIRLSLIKIRRMKNKSLFKVFDNEKGTSMEPILAAAKPLVDEIEGGDYEIVRMEYDLIFSEKSTYRTLFDGWTYGIAAFGDYRIKRY